MQENNQPTLYIVRGLPGSGKSTFVESLFSADLIVGYYEADMWMYDYDEVGGYVYNWHPSKLPNAHNECQESVENCLRQGFSVAVSNVSSTEKEVQVYTDMAQKYNARVVSLIIENRHGGKNSHGVADVHLDRIRQRFSFKL